MASPTPVLNLDSLVDRPVVLIDGKEYWLVTPDILPPLDSHRIDRWIKRASELEKKADLSTEEEGELEALPDRICRVVLEAPAEILDKLTNRQRALIFQTAITTFRTGLRLLPPTGVPVTAAPDPSTGANGSPASSDSTEAIP